MASHSGSRLSCFLRRRHTGLDLVAEFDQCWQDGFGPIGFVALDTNDRVVPALGLADVAGSRRLLLAFLRGLSLSLLRFPSAGPLSVTRRDEEHQIAPTLVADRHLALNLIVESIGTIMENREGAFVPPSPQRLNFQQSDRGLWRERRKLVAALVAGRDTVFRHHPVWRRPKDVGFLGAGIDVLQQMHTGFFHAVPGDALLVAGVGCLHHVGILGEGQRFHLNPPRARLGIRPLRSFDVLVAFVAEQNCFAFLHIVVTVTVAAGGPRPDLVLQEFLPARKVVCSQDDAQLGRRNVDDVFSQGHPQVEIACLV
mmetsp:Transcript_3027/g.8234  ORF Transcript_3027/g.8234 Transcript_3027/m.8234 type:complete len:312 (+) Transcript_3027:438-1373(+)